MIYLRLSLDPDSDFDRPLYALLQRVPPRSRGTFLKIIFNDVVKRQGDLSERTRAFLRSVGANGETPVSQIESSVLQPPKTQHIDSDEQVATKYREDIADTKIPTESEQTLSRPINNRTIETIDVPTNAAAAEHADPQNAPDLSVFEA